MWNGNGNKTFPSTESNLKTVLIKNQTHINHQNSNNNIKLNEYAKANKNSSSKSNNTYNRGKISNKCTDRIAIDMELLMHKKCIAHHSA